MSDTFSFTRASFRPQLHAKNRPISGYQKDRVWRVDKGAIEVGTAPDTYTIDAVNFNPRAEIQGTATDLVYFPSQSSEGAGSRFVFDVGAQAVRAGHVNLQQWDVANRAASSVAFGVDTMATGVGSVVLGGGDGTASGEAALVLGGTASTASGANSWAAGTGAMATNATSFVWASPNPALPTSLQSDFDGQATFAASGGFKLVSGGTGVPAYVPGQIYIDAPSTVMDGALNIIGSLETTGLAITDGAAAPNAPPAGTGTMWALTSGPDSTAQFTPSGGPDKPLGTANIHAGFLEAAGVVSYDLAGPGQSNDNSWLFGCHQLTGPSIGFRFILGAVGNPGQASFQAGEATTDEWDTVGSYSVAMGLDSQVTGDFSCAFGGQSNVASGDYSTVVGGQGNQVTSDHSFCGGGLNNTVAGDHGTLIGGEQNQVMAQYGTVGGGRLNTVSGVAATVMSGSGNHASGDYSTIVGGQNNTASGENSTVGGGIGNFASGLGSFVGGGGAVGTAPTTGGVAGNVASGAYSVVTSGTRNVASGDYATVLGGSGNTASGDYSVAIGTDADTNHKAGTFALSDQNGLTGTEVTNSRTLYAGFEGGVHFITSAVRGVGQVGVTLGPGESQWASISDRRLKENLREFVGVLDRVEELPLYEYSYIGGTARSRGPMAQDWHRLFPSAKNPLAIDTQDLDGVAMAALKELAAKTTAVASSHHAAMDRAGAALARIGAAGAVSTVGA